MSKQQVHTFMCVPKQWQVTKWYKNDDGEVMAHSLIITEHMELKGSRPPTFATFVGHGELTLDAPMGPVQVPYDIPIQKATTIKEAADMVEEVDKEIAPQVERQAKQQLLQQIEAERNKVRAMRELPSELGGKILRP